MKKLLAILLIPTAALAQKNTQTNGGRYQLIQLSEMRRDQCMIDTQTGRIWRSVCLKPGEGSECLLDAWIQEKVQDINIDAKGLVKAAAEAK